jgi:hypothetical protein
MYDTLNPMSAFLGNIFSGVTDVSWLVKLLSVFYDHVPAKQSKQGLASTRVRSYLLTRRQPSSAYHLQS